MCFEQRSYFYLQFTTDQIIELYHNMKVKILCSYLEVKTGFFILFLFNAICSMAQPPVNNASSGNDVKTRSFSYKLDAASMTSAGIYDSKGVLIRTLWAQQKNGAGTHTASWDGLDDEGKEVSEASYSWKVLTNNVKYTWQGIIGNTSDSMSGTTKHKGYQPITTMCFAGSTAYYGVAYNEALTMTYKFDTSHVGQRKAIQPIPFGTSPSVIRNCTDGNYVYWLGVDSYAPNNSFVYATKVSDDSRVTFSGGKNYAITYSGNQPAYNVIGFENDMRGNGTDVTVQRTGNYLFLTRNNQIFVLNKTSGNLVDSVPLSGVKYVRIEGTDGFLWANYNSNLTQKFIINSNGTLTSTGLTIVSSQPVVGIDISSDNSRLAIMEGGTNQQVRFYNTTTGIYISSFGQTGGFLTNATVTNNKFYWNDRRGTYPTFIAFTPNGSFWIGDWGNGRVQHYNANNAFLSRIMWKSVFYNIGVDYGNVGRVFADLLEYHVDWTKKLDNGKDSSWTLVNNWGGDVQPAQYNPNEGLHNPLTFPNGHTYCFVVNDGSNNQLVELKPDGTKEYTGTLIPRSFYLDKSFSLYKQSRVSSNGRSVWTRKRFTNTYKSNLPLWSNEDTLQVSPVSASGNEPGYQGDGTSYRPDCITDDSVYIAFSTGTVMTTGYHLGGVKNNIWIFKTAKATALSYKGTFPTGDKFDIGNGVRAPGGVSVPLRKTFIWSYHGEGWKASQTNIFTHTYENGLVINQFGVATGLPAGPRSTYCYPGDAGNAFSVHVITVHGNSYLIHNDESIQGGIHVWKITGMNTIHLLFGSFTN